MKKRHDKYGPLMSSRQNLYGSIYYRPDDYRVTVGTEVPYAAIHNEGLRAGRGKGFKMPNASSWASEWSDKKRQLEGCLFFVWVWLLMEGRLKTKGHSNLFFIYSLQVIASLFYQAFFNQFFELFQGFLISRHLFLIFDDSVAFFYDFKQILFRLSHSL